MVRGKGWKEMNRCKIGENYCKIIAKYNKFWMERGWEWRNSGKMEVVAT